MNDDFFTNCKTKCISDMYRLGTYFFIADWRIEDEEDWCGAGKNADLITDLIWRLVRVSLFSVLMRAGKPLKWIQQPLYFRSVCSFLLSASLR